MDSNVYSPCHGTVIGITHKDGYIVVCIFMAVTDNHDQFYPVSGEIESVTYDRTGKFQIANSLHKSRYNEKCIHMINSIHGKFRVDQIAGLVARRIVWYRESGPVQAKQMLGRILLGSRTDIYIPVEYTDRSISDGTRIEIATAAGTYHPINDHNIGQHSNFRLHISIGDKVKGPESILGHYL